VTEELEPVGYILDRGEDLERITGDIDWATEQEREAEEPLFAASDIIRHFELNELINQLAIAHRELQSLKDDGIDDADRLDQRIEANQRLQKKIENFRESSQEVDD
jgi:hypothetical protein